MRVRETLSHPESKEHDEGPFMGAGVKQAPRSLSLALLTSFERQPQCPRPMHAPAAIDCSTARRRMDGLDVLRACAILGVLLFHAPEVVHHALPAPLRAAFTHGWMGVNLFFVLSGYLVGKQVFAPEDEAPLGTRLRVFWLKRWMRTLPLYFGVLAIYALKPWTVGTPFLGGGWHYAVFLQNFSMPRDFVQSWSLCVEEHFYFVLPLVAFAPGARRWPAWVWLLPLGLSILARALFIRGLPLNQPLVLLAEGAPWSTDQHLDGLAVGVFLARTSATWRDWSRTSRLACAFLGGVALLVTVVRWGAVVTTTSHPWIHAGLAVGFGGVLIGVESLQLARGFRWSVQQVALLSYGAYLWHGLVVRVAERMGVSLGLWSLDLLTFLLITLGGAWVTYFTVEKPCLKIRDAILERWKLRDESPLRDNMTGQKSAP
ncbi:acyltransferase [Myxococcus sp. K15C18031901]|uniref:acyltransferase family protein n=1 Tax=Myxococcus dinghuensis TaxID=2906761 RepID=UPI0020A7297B|nr:acyltransferase [Myxococcus dinghuensis]MCP3104747.1 acyltransferase [Myxococcus dinghuensis]